MADVMWRFDFDLFDEALAAVCDEMRLAVHKATGTTLRKVGKATQGLVVKEVTEVYNLTQRDAKKKVVVKFRGDRYRTEVVVTISGRSMSLGYFNPRQGVGNRVVTRTKTRTLKRQSKLQGTEVEVVRGRKVVLPHAFIQRFASGHVGVMRRASGPRYPVEVKAAVSVASMFQKDLIEDRFHNEIVDRVEKEFPHQLAYYLGEFS